MNGNSESTDRGLQILLKAWDTMQELAKSNGQAAWTIRAWGISVWCALVAYAVTNRIAPLLLVAIAQLTAAFLMEMAARQVQYAFIARSLEIEKSIESVLVGEGQYVPEGGISTNIPTPTIHTLGQLLSVRRWQHWFPYVVLIGFSFVAYALER